jgi:hypothetical protein
MVVAAATGALRLSAPPLARLVRVELAGVMVVVVDPTVWVRTTPSLAHRSVALPVTLPDWVQVPGARVNDVAGAVPTFLIVTVVLTVWPGTIVVLPPYLLIVEQVAALVATLLPVPSVLRQVVVPAAFCSCMINVPAAAVLTELVIDAVKAARLLFIDSARMTTPRTPVSRASGVNRLRRAGPGAGEGGGIEDMTWLQWQKEWTAPRMPVPKLYGAQPNLTRLSSEVGTLVPWPRGQRLSTGIGGRAGTSRVVDPVRLAPQFRRPPTVAAVTVRWLVVLIAAAALVVTPLAVQARPAAPSEVSAADLVTRVQGSGAVAWSGSVESAGSLQVPDSDSFANLAQLLGEQNDLRVWWRSVDDWRVDRIRSSGESDLFRNGGTSIRWVFESETATFAPVSRIRLPDASDLLPPTLGRSLLQGARADELVRLPTRRLADMDAPGVRLTPRESASTIGHVDLWAEPETGLPLRVELYGVGDERPVVSTALVDLDLETPDQATTRFTAPGDVTVNYDESVDIAAAANAFAPFDLPASLAGLGVRSGEDPGAVGIYGRGPTTVIALPLRGQVARPLRERLQSSGTAQETGVGTLAPLGPVGLLVTPDRGRGTFLIAGTVTGATLERAARELLRAS